MTLESDAASTELRPSAPGPCLLDHAPLLARGALMVLAGEWTTSTRCAGWTRS